MFHYNDNWVVKQLNKLQDLTADMDIPNKHMRDWDWLKNTLTSKYFNHKNYKEAINIVNILSDCEEFFKHPRIEHDYKK